MPSTLLSCFTFDASSFLPSVLHLCFLKTLLQDSPRLFPSCLPIPSIAPIPLPPFSSVPHFGSFKILQDFPSCSQYLRLLRSHFPPSLPCPISAPSCLVLDPFLPITPSPFLPITPSPFLPITPSSRLVHNPLFIPIPHPSCHFQARLPRAPPMPHRAPPATGLSISTSVCDLSLFVDSLNALLSLGLLVFSLSLSLLSWHLSGSVFLGG